MPLLKSKSKKAFGKNVSAEVEAGKPQKQALAVAYDVQRRNRKKMASGGMAMESSPSMPDMSEDMDDADSVVDRLMNKHKKDDSDDVLEGLGEDTVFASEGGLMYDDEDRSSIDQNGKPITTKAYPSLNEAILKENYNEPINDVTYPSPKDPFKLEDDESVSDRIRRKLSKKGI